MRLLIDLQGAQTGSRFRGIGRYSLALSKAIARIRGDHDVLIALSDQFPETIDTIRAEFAEWLPSENLRVWHAVGPTREVDPENQSRREVSERIREAFLASLQPDIILVTSLFEGLGDDAVGSLGSLNFAIPTAVILYDLIPLVNPDEHFRSSSVHQEWYGRKIKSLQQSDLLLAISESSRQEALKTQEFAGKKIVNISGACDDSFRIISPSEDDVRSTWSRYGINRPFVMYTGGADERKNLHRLVEAFSRLPAELRDCHQLLLAGKMPESYIDAYHATARKCGLNKDELLIPGYVDDIDLLKLYNTCALFVFPSLHEGFGIPPLEAMACGAPVIGANSTSLPEVIGLPDALFDPTSIPQISEKIIRSLSDEAFRNKLIAHGKNHFKSFSWEQSARVALTALESLLNPKAARISNLLNVERTSLFTRRDLKILAIKLDHLGDFILAIPALSKLRARYPYASIDVVVGSWNAALATETGLFDKVYKYDFFRQKSSHLPKQNEDALSAALAELGEYDIALDLRRPADTRFFLAKTRAKMKIGYCTFDESIDREITLLLTQQRDAAFVTTPLNRTSISVQMMRVVDAIPTDVNDFVKFPTIGPVQEKQNGWIALFPKAGLGVREWHRSNFETLLDLLVADPLVEGVQVYFSNSREASEFGFQRNAKVVQHIGLSITELTRSLSRNSVCIANNSGGAHLASYLGVTVIAIYSGHELPAEWAPQFFDSLVIERAAQCAPCHGARPSDCPNNLFCLTDVHAVDVYSKTIEAVYANSCDRAHSQRQPVALQKNTDAVVGDLLASIAKLQMQSNCRLIDIAVAIAKNHPGYSMKPDLRKFELNVAIDHRSTLIDWRGFSGIERDFRWSEGNKAAMLFECPAGACARGVLLLHIDCLGQQRLIGHLNGVKVMDTQERGKHVHLRIPVRNLESGLNSLEFELPDARQPGNGDSRYLAIAVREFTVKAEELAVAETANK